MTAGDQTRTLILGMGRKHIVAFLIVYIFMGLGVVFAQASSLPSSVEDCVKGQIGESGLAALKSGQGVSVENNAKITSCFHGVAPTSTADLNSPGPGDRPSPPAPVGTPSREEATGQPVSSGGESDECVKVALGDDYQKVRAGQSPLSDDANAKVRACFKNTTTAPLPPVTTAIAPPAGLNDALRDCLEKNLGKNKLDALLRGQGEHDAKTEELTRPCFSQPGQVSGSHAGDYKSDPVIESCMQEAFGSDLFAKMKRGETKPDDAAQAKAQNCFTKAGKSQPAVAMHEELPAAVRQCLVLAQVSPDVLNGKRAPSLDERQAGMKCMGGASGVVNQDVAVKLDDSLKTCFEKTIGTEAFKAVSSGQRSPTDDEHKKGEACLSQGRKKKPTAETILPPAPETVPLLPIKTEAVSLDAATPQASILGLSAFAADEKLTKVTLKGQAAPKAAVDIFVFSSPIQATTQADASGRWSYNVARGLPDGRHVAYATTTAGGQTVRSQDVAFTVGAVSAPALLPSATVTAVATATSTVLPTGWRLITAGIGALIVIIAATVMFVRLKQRGQKPPQDPKSPA